MFFITATYKSQTVTTFTATDITVTNTLTSSGQFNADGISATDTIKAADDVMIKQNLHVDGNFILGGNISALPTSTANLGEVNASSNIKTQGAFIFNTPSSGPDIGLKVFNSTNPINTGRIIQIGDPQTFPTVPVPCSQANGQPWLYVNGGIISKVTNNLVNASVSMYAAPWNGSGFIETEGVDDVGAMNTGLYLNYFCGRNVSICENTGLTNGGGKVSVGNFLSAAQHVEIGSQQYGIASNNSPANNIALDMHVNNGKAIKVRTYVGGLSMFEIENTGTQPLATTVFKIDGNGYTKIGGDLPTTTPYMLTVNGRIGAREIKVSMQNPWPDYVFHKDYKLQSLETLESYLAKNKHLPNIPSADELNKEICGLDLAEMQGKQMEKIEEIYLHLIELNKKVKELQKENADLKKQIKK